MSDFQDRNQQNWVEIKHTLTCSIGTSVDTQKKDFYTLLLKTRALLFFICDGEIWCNFDPLRPAVGKVFSDSV